MPELTTDFQSLPEEYQYVIRLVQDQYKITVAPLQILVGGWSGAVVYLVSVSANATKRVEHCVLKLDRKGKNAGSDEVTRHNAVMNKSSPEFARAHIAELVFDRVEHEGTIAIFYRIAGQSLLKYLPLSKYERQSQLKTLFTQTNTVLLNEWNGNATFEQAVHPQKVLERWLGFRLDAGGNTERFLQETRGVNPDTPGLLINGHVFPNPLLHARKPEPWGNVRAIDVATGFIHGDLNTNNILVKFADDQESLEGYYLIDFALFKEKMPLLYDQRYLEMSYLMHAMSQVSFAKCVNFFTLLAVADVPNPHQVPIEMSGVSAVIGSARSAFASWVQENHPSLHDDLWGQYWLAGVAAGLAYCHKAGQPDEQRLAGLIYAAANLKRYATSFNLPLPTNVELLYDENPSDADASGISKTKKAKHNLPMQLTSLLGRGHETGALSQRLRSPEVRLVTITGPGGVGKTSLALQVAHDLQDAFADGVFFISLAAITDSTLIIPTIAHTLGVIESPNRLLLNSLKDFLRDRQALLLLDNFEQIISAAPLLSELLSACAGLRMLATSREALRLRGEQEFPLSPLALPDQSSVETLMQYPGIALFVQRAQAIQPVFKLTAENAAPVVEICERLDGLPLAIELAAVRIKLLPPQAMLVRLQESSLGLLTSGAHDLPVRQQTLRSAIQWSYDLLNAHEQRTFRWMSAFVSGCTLQVALTAIEPPASLDMLDSLVNKSLLRQSEADGEPRLTMLETIREFGLDELTRTQELEAARHAHANYYLSFAEQAETRLTGADQKAWLKRLEREQDNLRAALQWAIEQHEGELAQRMAGALQPFWFRRGSWSEGRRWLEEALALDTDATPAPAIRAKALYGAGLLARYQGDAARARILCEQSLALYRGLSDQSGVVMTLVQLARIGRFQDDQTAMQAFLAEAVALIDALPDTVVKADAYVDMVIAELYPSALQQPREAARYLAESERIQRALNNPAGLAFAIAHQANLALLEGDDSRAASRFDEAERMVIELGDDRVLGRLALSRLPLDLRTGDFAAARHRLDNSLQQASQRGDRHLPSMLTMLVVLLHGQGLSVWAARVFGLVEVLPQSGHLNLEAVAFWQHLGIGDIRAEVRAQLGEEAFAREIAAGQRLRLEDLLAIPHPQGPASAQAGPPSAPGASLTAREIEVLHLLAQDLSSSQIAERLVVSRRTVDAHLRSIYDKLGVKSRDAATRVARENRLI